MTLVALTLFAVAFASAIAVIVGSFKAAVPAISSLRASLANDAEGVPIHVSTVETRSKPKVVRRHRGPIAKPVKHRLHHFSHVGHAA